MKKIFATAILILAVLVSACGAEEATKNIAPAPPTPAADVSVLCEGILHFDDNSLKKIGMTRAEYEKMFINEFAQSFVQSSGVAFSDEQIKKINDSVIGVLKRAQFKTETVSENGDKATVKITVDTFEKLSEDMVTSKIPADISSKSDVEIMSAVADAMVSTFNGLKTIGTSDITIECQYNAESKMWLPVELEKFSPNVVLKVFDF